MCLDQFVAHCLDIIDIQLCCGMWFEHGGLIDLFFGSGGCGFDGQELDVDIGHIHGCQLDRESSYVAWLMPLASTIHGTSTQASDGRLSIRPVFNTLPPILYGLPVTMASII